MNHKTRGKWRRLFENHGHFRREEFYKGNDKLCQMCREREREQLKRKKKAPKVTFKRATSMLEKFRSQFSRAQ